VRGEISVVSSQQIGGNFARELYKTHA
jgi:hypothetical protein